MKLYGESGKTYKFEGPFASTDELKDRSGVYAILCGRKVIDVGEASAVKSRIKYHERKSCWRKNCKGEIRYVVYYIKYGKKPSRMKVEQDIRRHHNLYCGRKK